MGVKFQKIFKSGSSVKNMDIVKILKSVVLFIIAGFCEIGGGYGIWVWLREGKTIFFGILGMFLLILYGFVPTFQPAHFGRVYAAYGGVFVVMSLLWGWKIDGIAPDKFDIIGGAIVLIGVFTIMYSRDLLI